MFIANMLSRYMQCPSMEHFGVAERVLRYIRGIAHSGLWFRDVEDGALIGYCDSYWGGYLDDSKSTHGYYFSFPSDFFFMEQDIMAQSTAETEYMTAASTANLGIWLTKILSEFDLSSNKPTVIYVDNKLVIVMSTAV